MLKMIGLGAVVDKAPVPVVVRSYKSLDVANPLKRLQGKCLAVDPKKVAAGAEGADELCRADTTGGACQRFHLCPHHLGKPLLLIEDFLGTSTARFVRYCSNTQHRRLMDIANFTGFAKLCDAHQTGATLLGRKAVLPSAGEEFHGVAATDLRLDTLVAGSPNTHRRDLERCDVSVCEKESDRRKTVTGLCRKHVKVCYACTAGVPCACS